MKRFLLILLSIILCVSVFGCAKPQASESTISEVPVESSEPEVVDQSLFLEPLFKGIIDLEERAGSYGDAQIGGGSFVPMRFSHERIDAYEDYAATAKVGTPYFNCTTGVRMDFYTDAKSISFSYVVKESFFDRSPDHPDDCFALFENGVLKQTYLVQNGTNMDLTYTREEQEESRITIVFPNWHGVSLSDFNLGNARPYTEYSHSFLFLGDSIAQGLFADNPAESWTHLVAEAFNADYVNLAVGGEVFRTDSMDYLENFNPTHIFVALGENDYYSGVPDTQMAQNCTAYLEELKMMYPNCPVTVISSFNNDKPENYANAMLTAAKECGCNTIDGTGFGGTASENWNVDKVHPSSAGFKAIAQNLIEVLEPVL